MHVLFITHKFPPSIGGMQKQCFELYQGISRKTKTSLIAPEESQGSISFFMGLRRKVKRVLSENPDISVIHLNDGVMGVACLWLTTYTDIPIVLTVHGLDVSFPNLIYKKLIIHRFNGYAKIIPVSRYTATICQALGIKNEKLHVINNGVDTFEADEASIAQYKKQILNTIGSNGNNAFIISACGRAVKRKGFSWFIEEVLPYLEKVKFVMVGPINSPGLLGRIYERWIPQSIKQQLDLFTAKATDSEKIHSLLKDNRFKSKAVHLGKVSSEELEGLYAASHLFVMPNIPVVGDTEGFGLVALEAGSRQVPVLASNIEGITDAIKHDINGLLLPSKDKSVWIDEISRLRDSEESRVSIGKSAKDYNSKQFSWDRMVTQYLDIFEAFNKKKISKEDQLSYIKT